VAAKCPTGVGDLTDLGRVTAIECPTGVDDLLIAAFAKDYIYSEEFRSILISWVLRLEFEIDYYSKTFVIDHM